MTFFSGACRPFLDKGKAADLGHAADPAALSSFYVLPLGYNARLLAGFTPEFMGSRTRHRAQVGIRPDISGPS